MLRLLPISLVVALLAGGVALAAEPQKRIRPADQARARAMLLEHSDVGPGFRVLPKRSSGPTNLGLDCPALDESDLTITGEAESPSFSSGIHTIASAAEIYVSSADAGASWRRGTGTAGFACIKNVFRRLARATGVRFVSFRTVPFPAVAPRTVAFRWQTLANGIRVYADIVFLMRSRAQAAAFFVSGVDPLEREEQLRLTRLISKRMAKALRSP